jgi:LmbE family N-acetylglucosaminyl deacetylase
VRKDILSRSSRTVVVSPHLDDAALSCGGQLAGEPAHVITVFAGVPDEVVPLPTWDRLTGATSSHQRVVDRLAEDDRALGRLGTTTERLPLLDGQYRTEVHDHHGAVELLRPLLATADEIWAAAGIGHHVDHLAARDAALGAAPPGASVRLFADLPHALVYGWPSWVDPQAQHPFVDSGPWLEAELESAGLLLEALTARPHRLSAAAAALKREALAEYTSQLPALDAQSGFRLSDPRVMAFELSWTVAPDVSPLRSDWSPGGSGGWLPGR